MKRSLMALGLSLAASTAMPASSGAEGFIVFSNVGFGTNELPLAPVTSMGKLVGSEFTAELLVSLDGGGTYSLVANSATPFVGTTGNEASGAGLFFGGVIAIPQYEAGSVNFIVLAYRGRDYAHSLLRGQSAPVVLSGLATGISPPGDLFSDNPAVIVPLKPFCIPILEPDEIELAGLGMIVLACRFLRHPRKATRVVRAHSPGHRR